jgi:hypothetical protein
MTDNQATAQETEKGKGWRARCGFGDCRHEGLRHQTDHELSHAQMNSDLCMAPTLGRLFDFSKRKLLQLFQKANA